MYSVFILNIVQYPLFLNEVFFCFEVDKNFYFWKLRPYKGVSFPFQQVFFVRREVRAYSINLWKYLQKESIDCEIKSS